MPGIQNTEERSALCHLTCVKIRPRGDTETQESLQVICTIGAFSDELLSYHDGQCNLRHASPKHPETKTFREGGSIFK